MICVSSKFTSLKMIRVPSLIFLCISLCYSKSGSENENIWKTRENLSLRFGSEFQKINTLEKSLSSVTNIINEIRDFQLFPDDLTGLNDQQLIDIDTCLDNLEALHSRLFKKVKVLKPSLVDAVEILREMVTGEPVNNMFEVLERGDIKRIDKMIEIKHQIDALWIKIDSLLITIMTGIGLDPVEQEPKNDISVYDDFFNIIETVLGQHIEQRYKKLEQIKDHLVSNGSPDQITKIYNIEKYRIKSLISNKNLALAEKKLVDAINRFNSRINIDAFYLLLARIYFLNYNFNGVLSTVTRVSNENKRALKYLLRIQSLYELQRYDDIINEMKDIDIKQFDGKNRNLLIWIFIESSLSADKLLNHSNLVSAIDKKSSYALHVIHSLSRTYLKNHDTSTAISVMNGAFNYKINSEIDQIALTEIKISLAQLNYEKGDYNKALSIFFQLINDNCDYERALFGILWCYIKLDQFEKAQITLRKLVNQSPESSFAANAILIMAKHYLHLADREWEKTKYLYSEEQRLSLLEKRLIQKASLDTSIKNNVKFNIAKEELSLLISRVKNEPRKGDTDFVNIYSKASRICDFIINHYSTGSFQEKRFSKNREKMLLFLDSLLLEINDKNEIKTLSFPKDLHDRTEIKKIVQKAKSFKIHAFIAYYKWKLDFFKREKAIVNSNLNTSEPISDTILDKISKQHLDSIIKEENSAKNYFFVIITNLLHTILNDNSDIGDAAYFRYQLGELYYENENSEYADKFNLYEKELDLYHFRFQDFQKGKIDNKPVRPSTPNLDHAKSIKQFKLVISEYPNSSFTHASHYSLAWCYNDLSMFDSAIIHMKKVAMDFPESPYAPQAWMYCGEYYFDKADLDQAAHCYQSVMKYPQSEWFDEALYKLAWSQYRQSNPNKAISSFLALVDLGENSPDGHSLLEKESLDYIAISFSETDITGEKGLKLANSFAKKMGNSKQGYKILHRLANVYNDQGRYDMAKKTYNTILRDYPGYPQNALLESELISVMETELASEDINQLKIDYFEKYNFNSAWAHNQSDTLITVSADSIAKKYLYDAALSYHQIALQNNSSTNYTSALNAYQTFIDNYPSSSKTNECHYNLAEIQFSIGNYAKAADEYMAVSKLYPGSKYRETAAWNAIVAAQNLLKKELSDK